jgi:DNA-binding NtrC family response regulator
MNVWVIDDEPEICQILDYLLKRHGHECSTFENPLLALEYLDKKPPAVIICDFKMPQISGLDFFLKIKHQWSGEFIILTGEPSADPKELQSIGIKEVLFKPRDLTRVLAVINDLMLDK